MCVIKQLYFGKSNLVQKAITMLLLLTMLLFLTGCHFNEDSVRLASKNEILQYAEQNFGPANYVSSNREEHSVHYVLRDEQYGFEYTVNSYVASYGMDGSIFGYAEQKSSDFEDVYWNYIYADLSEFIEKKTQELGVEFELSKYSREDWIGEVVIDKNTNYNSAVEFIEELSNRIIDIDNRGYYRNSQIYLGYKEDFGGAGAYLFAESMFKTREELDIDFYMNRASQLIKSDVAYQRMKAVKRSDVLGLSEFQIASILGTDNETKEIVTCYYFTANSKEYFITDVVVQDGSNNIRQHIYCITDSCSFSNNRYD